MCLIGSHCIRSLHRNIPFTILQPYHEPKVCEGLAAASWIWGFLPAMSTELRPCRYHSVVQMWLTTPSAIYWHLLIFFVPAPTEIRPVCLLLAFILFFENFSFISTSYTQILVAILIHSWFIWCRTAQSIFSPCFPPYWGSTILRQCHIHVMTPASSYSPDQSVSLPPIGLITQRKLSTHLAKMEYD